MYEEVVAIPLSDDAEIIDQRLLNSHLGIELVLGDARGLVLFSSSLAVPVISWGWK